MLTVKHNFPDVERLASQYASDIRDKAMASALNKTIDQAKTQMAREITARFNVSSSYAKARLKIRGASAKSGKLRLEATLIGGDGKRRSANVIAFVERRASLAQARKRAKAGTLSQLHVKIKRGGGAKPIKGAFIGNRGRTVFERVGNERLPIKPVQTVDIPQMFTTRAIHDKVVAFAKRKFPEVFANEVKFYLARGAGR